MEQTAFVTGADRGLGQALCAGLLQLGWRVFAGQYMPEWPSLAALAGRHREALHVVPLDVGSVESVGAAARAVAGLAGSIDVLINNAGIVSCDNERTIRTPQDYVEMHRLYDINALGPLRVVEAFLPLMDRGGGKRLCFVSSEAGSISRSERTSWFGYCMSKSALNMGASILFNDLRPQGYSFRVYHPGWIRSYMHGEKSGEADLEPEEAAAKALPILLGPRDDEDRLAMVDFEGREWPW
jgi:NAD(P)-dependent dehydrogenase (short-subunit alcohol dehydrogenase family)